MFHIDIATEPNRHGTWEWGIYIEDPKLWQSTPERNGDEPSRAEALIACGEALRDIEADAASYLTTVTIYCGPNGGLAYRFTAGGTEHFGRVGDYTGSDEFELDDELGHALVELDAGCVSVDNVTTLNKGQDGFMASFTIPAEQATVATRIMESLTC